MGEERRRILVVDDDLKLAKLVARALAPEHDAVVLTSVREALHRIGGGERFDLILCDLMMPGLSGVDLYHGLGSTAPALVERVAVLTGGAFTPRAAAFLEAVPIPWLEKPFSLAELREFVTAQLGRAPLNRRP